MHIKNNRNGKTIMVGPQVLMGMYSSGKRNKGKDGMVPLYANEVLECKVKSMNKTESELKYL